MAKITYQTPTVQTTNEARVQSVYIRRGSADDGVGEGQVVIEGVVQVGHYDGATFVEHGHEHFSERVPLATAVSFFGSGPVLATLEAKILQWMQTSGQLPAGTIS